MKFWRNFMNGSGLNTIERREKRSGSCGRYEPSSVPTRRRSTSLKGSTTSLSDDSYGTTFVELIKRAGTHLGVIVTGGRDTGLKPRIADLVPGSWAQRSDVLCVGDIILSLNGQECQTMLQHQIVELLDTSDKVQLEVKYRLPPFGPSSRSRTKAIQVTLRKENGSFGFVVRGGNHEVGARVRPFTIVHIDKGGPAQLEGTLRPGDRVLACNGRSLLGMKLPELQSLLYHQERDTVFTVEYDIARQANFDQGAVLIEIYREAGDILGVGLSRCQDTKAIIVESIKQASLADRCGALHLGDILLSVCGQPVTKQSVDEVTRIIRDEKSCPLQLEVLPGAYARSRGSIRASLPSPCFSTMQRRFSRGQSGRGEEGHSRLPRQLSHSSLTELQASFRQEKERKKFVSFTVELDRTGGPLGITLASREQDEDSHGHSPTSAILISSMMEGGLAKTTKAIQVGDELVEVNGVNVKGMKLGEAIPLLQNSGNVVKLKLTRVVTIPEREFHVSSSVQLPSQTRALSSHSFRCGGGGGAGLPPRPTPSPIYAPLNTSMHNRPTSPLYNSVTGASPLSNYRFGCGGPPKVSFKNNTDRQYLPTVTLLPKNGAGPPRDSGSGDSSSGSSSSAPLEVTKVTLFKDQVYEDFGFSVSDGLYERGIFINRIRKGGPADASGLLKPFDRILQINSTRTTDFDCCLAVPLIAAAGDKIQLLLTRPFPDGEPTRPGEEGNRSICSSTVPWIDETDQESTITGD